MNEISAKRKELEKEINEIYISGKTDGHKSRKLRNKKAELLGFNLGVEMARKEIFDIINKEIDRRGGMANRIDAIRILELLKEDKK